MRVLLFNLLILPSLFAQQTELTAQSNRLQILLRQIKPQTWPDSVTSALLLNSVMKDNQTVLTAAQGLASHPDQILESLQLLENVHAVQESVSLLATGVAKYQNAALAELIVGIQTEGKPARDAYRDHVLQLVEDREGQFQVADHEAQRCRAILSKDPRTAQRAVNSKQ